MDKKSVVVIGGGTGTHTILRGLKKHKDEINISSIVAMSDSGGSTGRLRDEFGYLPVGDVRMALTALASDVDEHEELLRELFLYRFAKGEGLSGHNFGNLLLVALTDILGSEEEAISVAARVLRVQGEVVPVTTSQTNLMASYSDGSTVVGQHEIDCPDPNKPAQKIVGIDLTPKVDISPSAQKTLLQADLIVLGPGDLYTSIIPNCLVNGVSEAILESKAQVVYVSNLMTRHGQTSGMSVADHAAEIARYIGRKPDVILVNNGEYLPELLERYAAAKEFPLQLFETNKEFNYKLVDLISTEEVKTVAGDKLKRSLIRHDSNKLAAEVVNLCRDI